MLCNVLVCLAVWLCFAAHTVIGKIVAIVFPISAFVALGFEHSVANMYLIPVTAMATDFLPKSLALGGIFAAGADGAVLLAILIGLQNLPEGFNAWRELAAGPFNRRIALGLMVLLAFFGPVCGLIGWFWLADQGAALGAIMLFAAGGILYLTFQDIAPQAWLERHWAPPPGNIVMWRGLSHLSDITLGTTLKAHVVGN